MILRYSKIIFLFGVLLVTSACDDFLDKDPDNRARLNNAQKISQLLVTAYSEGNPATIAELSSDNFIDNNSPYDGNPPHNLPSLLKLHDELFAWQPGHSYEAQDSPSYFWQKCYSAIAAANHALQAIEELERQGHPEDLNPQRGEALVCRAFNHFLLVNIFCQPYRNDELSKEDLGIPYVTKPETVVHGKYSRETVSAVYAYIQKDLEEGIPLISDEAYTQSAFHFTRRAAAAFAARFFLFKRDYEKVETYANQVLGSNAISISASMRVWKEFPTFEDFGYAYISPYAPCNLLLVSTNSIFFHLLGGGAPRYGHNRDARSGSTIGSGPTWSNQLPCFNGNLYSMNREYGSLYAKSMSIHEVTDKVTGSGYPHVVRAEFTTDETLLCRAEARIYLGLYDEAIQDLEIWNRSHLATQPLTESAIKNFYYPGNTLFVKNINPTSVCPDFIVTPEQAPFIHCVLHFRRIERMFDGDRWYDIKRYGIEIEHAVGIAPPSVLRPNDPRRAIQLPLEVTGAGLPANPS